MLLREDNSGGVSGVVDDDGSSAFIDEGLELFQVDQSTSLHVQFVGSVFDSLRAAESGVEREAGMGDEDVVSEVSHSFDGDLESVRSSAGKDDIFSLERGSGCGEFVDNGLAGSEFSN